MSNTAKLHPSNAKDERIAQLECLLEEIHEFLDGQIDVVDGDYGEPKPNAAMLLSQQIDTAMGRRP